MVRLNGRIAILIFWIGVAAAENSAAAAGQIENRRTITDLSGRQVSIPASVSRVACLTGACYEKVFLLGQADKIVARASTFPPWMMQTNPKARDIPTSPNPGTEDLLSRKVQLAFAFDRPQQLGALEAAGITAVVPASATSQESQVAFTQSVRQEVRFYGAVLGSEAAAEAWCAYYDRHLANIARRIASIPAEERPRVYYLRGPDALTTHGRNSNMRWYGEMAGGDMSLARDLAPGISHVNQEDIILWNPQVIFVGRQYSLDLVTKDPRWRDIDAVKNGRVYPIPDGVFFWDSSSEGILLLEFMAKTLHPVLFADLDMAVETKDYYATFYHYKLSDQDADNLLHGNGPDGLRFNPAGN
ncbi:MAG TPA: ABC transporter substrate-binding protein [Candidatus Sulfotelmatobacter sp.]|jgi:iron complex transport system substrate-binding protein|nr:ABC transporter substrate-binding protein [Candidatus Sulfotelmatobacter sp.]